MARRRQLSWNKNVPVVTRQEAIRHENYEAVLVKAKGSNTWLMNGWEVRPVASKVANETTGATQTSADSSDGSLGAGRAVSLPRFSRQGNPASTLSAPQRADAIIQQSARWTR
jgi:hypothetical protein